MSRYRVSRVATSSIFHACRHHDPGENDSVRVSLCFPNRRRLSPYCRRAGSRIALFEACSAFTHVPACMVAELLNAALRHRSASVHVVTSMSRPGCYQPKTTIVGWDSHPPGRRAFPRRTATFGLVSTANKSTSRIIVGLSVGPIVWVPAYASGIVIAIWRPHPRRLVKPKLVQGLSIR